MAFSILYRHLKVKKKRIPVEKKGPKLGVWSCPHVHSVSDEHLGQHDDSQWCFWRILPWNWVQLETADSVKSAQIYRHPSAPWKWCACFNQLNTFPLALYVSVEVNTIMVIVKTLRSKQMYFKQVKAKCIIEYIVSGHCKLRWHRLMAHDIWLPTTY